jgi:hypothetical protein
VGEVYTSPKENVYRKEKIARGRVYHHPPLYTPFISPFSSSSFFIFFSSS